MQVVDRFCEIYGSQAKRRAEDAMQIFHPELRVTVLSSGAVVERGLSKLKVLLGEVYAGKCEAGKRVFIEPERGDQKGPTFCLDMYDQNRSPGLGPKGFTAVTSEYVVVLYRVEENRINQIWVSDDEDRLAANPGTSKAGLTMSDTWEKVVEVIQDNIKSGVACHFSNYSQTEDATGLGIGSSTKVITFSL